MKKGIHPDNYRPVVFKDMSNEEIFITRSTVAAKETIEIDGVTYPLVKLEITSSSHPFPSRTRRLRPNRPMVLHWRRCGRAGGRQIKKKETGEAA